MKKKKGKKEGGKSLRVFLVSSFNRRSPLRMPLFVRREEELNRFLRLSREREKRRGNEEEEREAEEDKEEEEEEEEEEKDEDEERAVFHCRRGFLLPSLPLR